MRIKKEQLLYPAAFLLIVLIGFGFKFVTGKMFISGEKNDLIETVYSETTGTVTETTAGKISIYLCGEVNKPGVYEIDKGEILNKAVIMAGGLTDTADRNKVNLVYIIKENISVYIPKTDEDMRISADLFNEVKSDAGPKLVNINTSGREELMTLPGIGETMAGNIIRYREKKPFTDITEIMNVEGIGQAKFDKIKDDICI